MAQFTSGFVLLSKNAARLTLFWLYPPSPFTELKAIILGASLDRFFGRILECLTVFPLASRYRILSLPVSKASRSATMGYETTANACRRIPMVPAFASLSQSLPYNRTSASSFCNGSTRSRNSALVTARVYRGKGPASSGNTSSANSQCSPKSKMRTSSRMAYGIDSPSSCGYKSAFV